MSGFRVVGRLCAACVICIVTSSAAFGQAAPPGGTVNNSSTASATTIGRINCAATVTTNAGWTLQRVEFELGDMVGGMFVTRNVWSGAATKNAAGDWVVQMNGITAGQVTVRAWARYSDGMRGNDSQKNDVIITVR